MKAALLVLAAARALAAARDYARDVPPRPLIQVKMPPRPALMLAADVSLAHM